MPKEFIPLSVRIKDAILKLKDAGYIVFNTNDEKFAILAEKKKILCKDCNEFFHVTSELTKKK